ncbi:hypothetical protein Golob_018370 [Gossypium lobatum]|uniref:Uncharacterized protein n=1 Tax=Gossypium lobatum TaxID=34289 RepID=A0A7J8MA47_9ROSI|nr:hypothetical protein [Gossypium lobatum]
MEEFRPSSYQEYGGGDGGRNLEIIDGNVLKYVHKPCYASTYPPPFDHHHHQKQTVPKKKKKSSSLSIKSWWNDPKMKRKMRLTGYKMYAIEGKIKTSLKKAHKWIKKKPLETPSLKISFDAAFQSYAKKSCSGIAGKNSEGTGIPVLAKKLHAQNEDGSVISAYVTDAKSLSEICDTCIFKHVLRKENGLARGETTYLVERVPLFAASAVEKDRRRSDPSN